MTDINFNIGEMLCLKPVKINNCDVNFFFQIRHHDGRNDWIPSRYGEK